MGLRRKALSMTIALSKFGLRPNVCFPPIADARSQFERLGKLQSVVDLHTEIPDGAFQLRVAQQELASAEITDLLVEQRDLLPTKAMGAVSGWVEPDERNPLIHQPCVLARTQVTAFLHAAGEQPIVRFEMLALYPGRN
jgi:hypothetical protein